MKGLARKFGIKLKPWQAVKTADQVGRVAKHAAKIGTVLAIVDGGREAFDEVAQFLAERKRQARRRATVSGVTAEAQRTANELHADVRAQIQAQFSPYIAEIDDFRQQVIDAQTNRSQVGHELDNIVAEARGLLEVSTSAPTAGDRR